MSDFLYQSASFALENCAENKIRRSQKLTGAAVLFWMIVLKHMKIRNQKDFVSGLALIVVGIGFAIGATNYSFGSAVRPGPGYFPFGLGIILALLGAIIFVGSLLENDEKDEKDEPIGPFPWRALFCIVGALVFFGFCLPRLGFLISFPSMIIITALGGTEFRWRDAFLSAAVLTTLSYLLFIKGLDLNMPLWPI